MRTILAAVSSAAALVLHAGPSPAAPADCSFRNAASGFINTEYYIVPISDYPVGDLPLSKAVGVAENGRFLVVWGQRSVDAQLFSAAGSRIGGLQTVTPSAAAEGDSVAVATTPTSGFIVAWAQETANGRDVFARLYDPSALPAAGVFQANSYVAGHQYDPVVAAADDGGFTIAWASDGVHAARRFASDGTPVANEFPLGLKPHAVGVRADGTLDVMGTTELAGFNGTQVAVERFAAAAETPTETLRLMNHRERSQMSLTADGFVNAWITRRIRRLNRLLVFDKVMAKAFHLDGTPTDRKRGMSRNKKVAPVNHEVNGFADGGFVVTWQRGPGPSGESSLNPPDRPVDVGIWARVVDAQGDKTTRREKRVDQTNDRGYEPAIGAGEAGDFVVAWHSLSTTPYSYGAHYGYEYRQQVRVGGCRSGPAP